MFAPFGLPSENRTAAWHPEPTSRGTFSIVSTCLITMALCIWTAVHLNIPGHEERIPQLRRKVSCVVIGLFAPELIAWTAYEQRKDARSIDRTMLKALRQKPKPSIGRRLFYWMRTISRTQQSHKEDESRSSEAPADQPIVERHPWTSIHGQYAAMGGYAIAPSRYATSMCPELPPRLVLDEWDLQDFATWHLDLLPDISETEIRDKSKASALAKTLVCIQAVWFCIQCVTRLAQGLTISLLELNTFAHAMCAILVYLLWWDKPLDVEEPTLMQSELFDAFQMARYKSTGLEYKIFRLKHDLDRLFALGKEAENAKMNKQERSNSSTYQMGWLRKTFQRFPRQKKIAWVTFRRATQATSANVRRLNALKMNEAIHGWVLEDVIVGEERQLWDWPGNRQFLSTTIELDASDMEKLRLLDMGYSYFRTCLNRRRLSGRSLRVLNIPDTSGLVRSGFSREPMRLSSILGLSTAGLLYGGIHLVAWNAGFPTHTQLLLWRLSGLILVSSGPVLSLLNIRMAVDPHDKAVYLSQLADVGCPGALLPYVIKALRVLKGLYYSILIACWMLYIFARVFLVVECFLTLEHLPPSVFEVPHWSQYMPHIT